MASTGLDVDLLETDFLREMEEAGMLDISTDLGLVGHDGSIPSIRGFGRGLIFQH